jgi:hypothetical protein
VASGFQVVKIGEWFLCFHKIDFSAISIGLAVVYKNNYPVKPVVMALFVFDATSVRLKIFISITIRASST